MSKNKIEKEIKIKITNIKLLEKTLKKNNAKFLGKDFQRTIRFDTQSLDLEKKGIFLRVRSGFGNIVTLKKKIKSDGQLLERLEIETEIEDIEKLRLIIKNLGFTKEFIMEKYRANWKLNNTYISIDEMPFGFFVEIEGEEPYISDTARLLKLDISNKITLTYWHLFEEYKIENNIKKTDIVFPKDYLSKT